MKRILQVDKELEMLSVRKKGFAKIARHIEIEEYEQETVPSERFIEKLRERGVDVFTFIERTWCCPISNPSKTWAKVEDNIALLNVTTYPEWLERVGKKTRNMIRKAEKNGVNIKIAAPDDSLAEGISRIYNETPVRQGRPFSHYGLPLATIKNILAARSNDTYIGAYLQEELLGFIQLVQGDRIAIISQILSLQQHSDKAMNNALLAKAVEICASKQCGWVMYGRMGNHPSLDTFKENNGFIRFSVNRFYVPITRKGRFAMSLGLHRELKDTLPPALKTLLLPVFSWVSRTKQRLRLNLSR